HDSVGTLWSLGADVNWSVLNSHHRGRRVPLPGYPFERTLFAVRGPQGGLGGVDNRKPFLGRLPVADWFSTGSWRKTPRASVLVQHASPQPSCVWLVLIGDRWHDGICRRLRESTYGSRVVTARFGDHFIRSGMDDYTISVGNREHYQELIQAVKADGLVI